MATSREPVVSLPVLPRVGTPCPMPWSAMVPDKDGRRRFCGHCQLHVHDVSALTAAEAAGLRERASRGEHMCINYYVDWSGEPITRDRRWRLLGAKAAAVMGGVASMLLAACTQQRTGGKIIPNRLGGSVPSDRRWSGRMSSDRLGGMMPMECPPKSPSGEASPGDGSPDEHAHPEPAGPKEP